MIFLPLCKAAHITSNNHLVVWVRKKCSVTSRSITEKINLLTKRVPTWRINLYTTIQVMAWLLFYKNAIKNPGDIYSLTVTIVIYTLFLLFIISTIFFDYFPEPHKKIKAPFQILAVPLSVATIYFCSSISSGWISEIFPFGPQNIKYSSAMATMIIGSLPISIVLITISILSEALILMHIIFINQKMRKTQESILDKFFLFFSLLVSTMTLAAYMPQNPRNNFSAILVARIAFDIDSIPIESCLSRKEIIERLGPLDSSALAVIPVATSLDKGYILATQNNLPTGKMIRGYTAEDRGMYIPKVIDYVDCDKLRYKSELTDKPASSASK